MRREIGLARAIEDTAELVAADGLQCVAERGSCMAVVEDEDRAGRLREAHAEQTGDIVAQSSGFEYDTFGCRRPGQRKGRTPDHQPVIRTQADAPLHPLSLMELVLTNGQGLEA